MYSLGLDIGSYAIKSFLLDERAQARDVQYIPHKGNIKPLLKDLLQRLFIEHDPQNILWGAVTGSGAKWLSSTREIKALNQIQALVEGALASDPRVASIIEIGGQSAKYITSFNQQDRSGIKISMNSSCSAGTGSFLEEQLSRLDLSLEDYSLYAQRAKSIPRIAGRCSVFAKTDITHHQQQGVPVEDILLGLAHAVVKNYRAAVMKKLPRKKPMLFAGGVAGNQTIIQVLAELLRLDQGELIVPASAPAIGALGAARVAMQDQYRIDPLLLSEALGWLPEAQESPLNGSALPNLAAHGRGDSVGKHQLPDPKGPAHQPPYYLGIDVGSTSTNLVLCGQDGGIIAFRYLPTRGKPANSVASGLEELQQEIGPGTEVAGVGVTGSGRYMIAELVGADVIKDEITAQARAATALDSDIDTVFEIGGQDSKYIRLNNGVVTDFQMNKVCAAGTGSFLEEQAKKFNLAMQDLGGIALCGSHPVNLGERCTVFMETSVAAQMAQGAHIEDIAAGLCYSIAKNYLHRVVGQKSTGRRISFQGGVAHNQGVVNALRALTGKPVQVLPFFSVSGAYGAALLAREEMGQVGTRFKGFAVDDTGPGEGGTKAIIASDNAARFNQRMERLVFEGYDGALDPGRKTVGIPRALFAYGMFAMFNGFFKNLGCNVLLSGPSNEETIRLAQEYSLDETCYPVKLIMGHMADLVQKKVDYIFFPDLYTVVHPGSHTRQNFGCPYMQLAFKIANQAMDLESKGIGLLAPTFAFNLGQEFMQGQFLELGRRLGQPDERTMQALQQGMQAFHLFEKRVAQNGQEAIRDIGSHEMGFVLVSKIYGTADPILNMGIPGMIRDLGHKVAAFHDLPEGDVSQEHPNMYWPFGQHILEAAQFIKQQPNLHAILLTHHGCGPDSVFTHYFREIMDGKPYLNIEVDEHSSDVGVITRVEAFVNSLRQAASPKAEAKASPAYAISHHPANLKTRLTGLDETSALYLPNLYPYAQIFQQVLAQHKINALVLAKTDKASIDLGRKYTLTNEYFTLTALLGDVLKQLGASKGQEGAQVFLIPQNEGAEVDGQYSRFVRTILDKQGLRGVDILTPFWEDVVSLPSDMREAIHLGLLAGDVIRAAPKGWRDNMLADVSSLIAKKRFDIVTLQKMADTVRHCPKNAHGSKTVMALGDPCILYNDVLNDWIFDQIEDGGHRVLYCPLSEYMWLAWRDFIAQNLAGKDQDAKQGLQDFGQDIRAISEALAEASPFAARLEDLAALADQTVGYYAGINGRYRQAKPLCPPQAFDGVINAASIYENTGIALGILSRNLAEQKPFLNLTFDGNKNENDQARLDSFLYYI